MINVIILAAGAGERFKEYSNVSKPFIEVRGKTILEHCTSSIPFILHDMGVQREDVNLWFAMRSQDAKYVRSMETKYGRNIRKNIVFFDKVTRGNLETAYKTVKCMANVDGPLYIFDCDNKFVCPELSEYSWASRFLYKFTTDDGLKRNITMGFGYEHNDPTDTRWANAVIRKECCSKAYTRMLKIHEKDPKYSAYPRLIGIFAYTSPQYFMDLASNILENEQTTANGEFYISQTLQPNDPFVVVDHFIPLGTPDDVKKFEETI